MKSHFKFDRQERNGIFFLLFTIAILQGAYFLVKSKDRSKPNVVLLDEDNQKQIDSIRSAQKAKKLATVYSFNPNFINDYKGYTLGMSPAEIDRLLSFREMGNYVNSAEEFQNVTRISDSLLQIISPNFKFPQWNGNPKKTKAVVDKIIETKDLNFVTAEELTQVKGIGEVLSNRIIKFRSRLGGFLVDEQLYDVYGLEAEVVERALLRFRVQRPPEIEKIKINSASVNEMVRLVYINSATAEEIMRYRQENGPFRSLEDLAKVFNVSEEKIDRIGLYLSLKED